MNELRIQQIEALSVAGPYCNKLLNAINNVVLELQGNRLPDTDAYLDEIVNGLNWVLEVTNGTLDLINDNGIIIDKAETNAAVVALSESLKAKDDEMIAGNLAGGIRLYLEKFRDCCLKYIENN